MLLDHKIAVITGNPYGIGRETAALFEREGARVISIDDSAHGWGTDSRPDFIADASDANAMAAVVAQCTTSVERVDILFNLAGRAVKQSFENTTEATWNRMIARNLNAAFICSKAFLPLMKKSRDGAIVNHASIDGFLGNPSLAAYSAGKGGVIPLTHVMAHDLGKYGIRVNCISTGGIRDGEVRAEDAARLRVTPSGRSGTPEDVARVALFLASDLSAYVNGANIVVDGGRTVITQGCYED
ncbi:MAG TPA: SDR family NAD(P)-dependent oxidoreductase [Burkholderiales bacterium]|nr:SDR family NAD(P)-dependent oxidoreductase [Burkholderiales bacterium]